MSYTLRSKITDIDGGPLFRGGLLSFELLVDLLDGIEVVFRMEQLAALNAEGFGNDEGLAVHPVVEAQQGLEFLGREGVPVDDGFSGALEVGMSREKAFFDVRIHPAVHPPDALHEADGIPVEVEVDEAVGVLEVEAFR